MTGNLIRCAALLLTMSLGSSETSLVPGGERSFEPYDVVGVCPVDSAKRSWSVVWHQNGVGADPKAARVFRNLESPDFNACLTLLIESDEATLSPVLRLASDPTDEHAAAATLAVRRRWTSFGVDRAILEVAETGDSGPAVERVFVSCEQIRHPIRIIGVSEEVKKRG